MSIMGFFNLHNRTSPGNNLPIKGEEIQVITKAKIFKENLKEITSTFGLFTLQAKPDILVRYLSNFKEGLKKSVENLKELHNELKSSKDKGANNLGKEIKKTGLLNENELNSIETWFSHLILLIKKHGIVNGSVIDLPMQLNVLIDMESSNKKYYDSIENTVLTLSWIGTKLEKIYGV